jgi:hypothetical protein
VDADLELTETTALAALIVDKTYKVKQPIFKQGENTKPALYLVREGCVRITTSDKSRSEKIEEGGYFGDHQLQADAEGSVDASGYICATYTATASAKCMVGILALEDCRTVLNTKNIGDKIYEQSMVILNKRSSVRTSIQAATSLKDVDKHCIIGTGQFAEVWLCSVKNSGQGVEDSKQKFALKVQKKEDTVRSDAVQAIMREITVIRQMNHPFIIDLVNVYEDHEHIYMLTSLVKGGELWSVIHREEEDGNWVSGLTEQHAKFYSLIVADTIAYMHRQQFIFRDLKPENILIDTEGYPNVVDFGFAKHITDKTYTFCGTPNYLAPEIVMNLGHANGADHWALGVLIYEMLAGENPFFYEDMDQMALFQAVIQDKFYPLPDTISPESHDLVGRLLEKDPTERLGVLSGGEKDILTHPWFADMDLKGLRQKEVTAPYIPPKEKLHE